MAYFRKGLGATYEAGDYVWDKSAMPACPQTDANGMCRDANGVAVQAPIVPSATAKTLIDNVSSWFGFALPSAGSTTKSFETAANLPPGSAAPSSPKSGGVTTRTMVAIGIAAVGLLYLTKRKR